MNKNLDNLTTEIIELYNKNKVAILIVAQADENDENHIRTKFSGNLVQVIQLASSGVMLLADQLGQQFNTDKESSIMLALDAVKDQLNFSKTQK
jgi:hypothetical protein